MEEHVELPVNKEGFMHSNTKQAGLYSIISSNEYAGKLNAIISKFLIMSNQNSFDYLSEAEVFVRYFKNVKLDFDNRHKELHFSSQPYTENKYAYLYKDIERENSGYSMQVKVDYIQDSDAWAHVKIAFSNGITGYDKELREAYFENECSLKLTSQGRLFFRFGSIQRDIRIFESGMGKPVFLKLALEFDSYVIAEYSFDGIHWNILCEEKSDCLEFEEAGLYIGPKINTFFYDFYISNTQLYFDSKNMRILTSPQLDHDDRFFSNMLEGYSIPQELISYSDIELLEFFMKLIVDHNYIYLQLHEFCIPARFHNKGIESMNIIYGFDKKRGVFKRMSFYQALEFSEISFDKFLTTYHYKNNKMDVITLYKYKSWRYPNNFDVDTVISNLKAYIGGESSFAVTSRKKILYLTEKPFFYGVKIYETIAEHDTYMNSFLMDEKLSGQIYEDVRIYEPYKRNI